MMTETDIQFIKICFGLARKGAGLTSPNPLVGSVIVKDGKIISEGYHQSYGSPHAEANAIRSSNQSLVGSTLYCNLEPCVHTDKQTPPCVPAIIACGIKRVVISNIDPNPKVAGKGIDKLREAGIEVEWGVCEEEGKEFNRFFFKYITNKKPYVTIKTAASLDGKITAENGKQTWLTGEECSKYVHNMRAEYDAVLVGAGTINIDNPMLNVRLVDKRNPVRIILSGSLDLNLDATVFNDSERDKTRIVCASNTDENRKKLFRSKGIRLIEVEWDEIHHLSINKILNKFAEENISSLLVEGGSQIFSRFISEDEFDEIIFLKAPIILGSGLDGIKIDSKKELALHSCEQLGKDIKLVYRKR